MRVGRYDRGSNGVRAPAPFRWSKRSPERIARLEEQVAELTQQAPATPDVPEIKRGGSRLSACSRMIRSLTKPCVWGREDLRNLLRPDRAAEGAT